MPLKIGCVPEVKNYHCCCVSCSLRRTSILLGWIELLIGLAQTAWFTFYLLKFEEIGRIFWFDSKELCIGLLSEGAACSLICMMYLIGVHRKSPCWMVLYLLLSYLGIFVLVAIVVVIGFVMIYKLFFIGLGIMMTGASILAFLYYLWVVKYSYYRALIQEKSRHRIEMSHEGPSPELEPMT